MLPTNGMNLNLFSGMFPDTGRFIAFGHVLCDAGKFIFEVFSRFIQGIKQTHEQVKDNRPVQQKTFCEKIDGLISATQEEIRSLFDLTQKINNLKNKIKKIDKVKSQLIRDIRNQGSDRRLLISNPHYYGKIVNNRNRNISEMQKRKTYLDNFRTDLNEKLEKLEEPAIALNNIFNNTAYIGPHKLFFTIQYACYYMYTNDPTNLSKVLEEIKKNIKKLRTNAETQKAAHNIKTNSAESVNENALYKTLTNYLDQIDLCLEDYRHKIDINNSKSSLFLNDFDGNEI